MADIVTAKSHLIEGVQNAGIMKAQQQEQCLTR